MILVDTNIALYACHPETREHEAARRWLDATINGNEPVAFALVTLLAFLRLGTDPRVFDRPVDAQHAIAVVKDWLEQANVRLVTPTDRHWTILSDLAIAGQARGPLLMDAHLAALAIEHNATLATNDRGFARFPGLKVRFPLAG